MTPDATHLLVAHAQATTAPTEVRLRARLFTGALLLPVGMCLAAGQGLGTRTTPAGVMTTHGALFAACLLVWLVALQAGRGRSGPIIIAAAIAARLALLPFPASDDVSRYLWEGRLVLEGESPYAAPASEAPEALRDRVWAGMNNKTKRTIYPPLAELVFAAGVAVAYEPLPLKLLFVAAEAGILGLLLRELRRRRLPEANLTLVAFNPVLLLATAGEGHYDALFVLALLLAVSAHARGRHGWGWIALAAAVQLKLVAVLLAPVLLRGRGWRTAWMFAGAAAVPALPFLSDLPNIARSAAAFAGTTYHNGFLPAVLRQVIAGTGAVAAVSMALLALWTAFVAWRVEEDVWRAAFLILGGLLLLSPITHVWYFVWIVPFLAILPQPAWLLASGLQAVYYSAWVHALATGIWLQPAWAWWVQWAPFAALLALTSWAGVPRLFDFRRPFEVRRPPPHTISAVVPAYEEADGIAACLQALRGQGPAMVETIVVDGGSRDATVKRALAEGARVIRGPRGRGQQIAAGLACATGDVIWLVHADFMAAPGTAAAILSALTAEPATCGGAAGLRFQPTSLLLVTIEALNAGRSALFGLSFGDQGQFFRRDAILELGGFPALPLMEDVELALRLRRAGPVLHLGRNGIASCRRWERARPLRRIGLVIRFVTRYLVSRRPADLAEELFRQYYAFAPPASVPTRSEVKTT